MDAGRRAEVEAALNGVVDPCSRAAGEPIGLNDLGVVRLDSIHGGEVTLSLLPTFPGCLYVGVFERELEERLRALAWCRSVRIGLAGDAVWDEERIAPAARERLARRRAAARLRAV